jgi:hypothetical protein
MRPNKSHLDVDKAKVCFFKRDHLSKEYFIELIGERVQGCEVWVKKLRSQGNLKDADRICKTKERMLKTLGGWNDINPRANRQDF